MSLPTRDRSQADALAGLTREDNGDAVVVPTTLE